VLVTWNPDDVNVHQIEVFEMYGGQMCFRGEQLVAREDFLTRMRDETHDYGRTLPKAE